MISHNMQIAKRTLRSTRKTPSALVIFFHGSGDTGPNVRAWVISLLGNDMSIPHIQVVYPTAPLQPYTPLNGEPSTVWFDRPAIALNAQEDKRTLSYIYKEVSKLIRTKSNIGITPNKIIVGGFSMGGALAMHTAFHLQTNVAGCFTCSSFLNLNSAVYNSLKYRTASAQPPPEIIMFHGKNDYVVPIEWGLDTYKKLKSLGVNAKFTSVDGVMHELTRLELLEIQMWIRSKLPL